MAVVQLTISKKDKILILAPHPDDECIGCGGILALYGNICDIVVLTDGSRGNRNNIPEKEKIIRKEQFINEMNLVIPNEYRMMEYKDGELLGNDNCLSEIDFTKYTKVFVPFYNDNHPDHTATFQYAINEIKKIRDKDYPEVYQYEVHVPFHDISHYLDISEIINKKVEYIRCHKDQIETICYDEIAEAQSKYRACFCNNPDGYYECYLKVDIVNEIYSAELVEKDKTIQKFRQFYRLLLSWIQGISKGKNVSELLIKTGINTISIYGYADIGITLENDILCDKKIKIIDILDKREILNAKRTVKKPKDGDRNVDAVVVTALGSYEEIKKELLEMGYSNIISLNEIVDKMK